jgi:hypothetical protein
LSEADSDSRETGFDEQMSPIKEQIEEKPTEGQTIEEPLSPKQQGLVLTIYRSFICDKIS